LGLRHQRAADGQHLLLAARQVAGLRAAALVQAREVAVDAVAVALHVGAAGAAHGRRGGEVLVGRQVLEHAPAFQHLHDAAVHARLRRQRVDVLAHGSAPRRA
jgi:hypothetical protein